MAEIMTRVEVPFGHRLMNHKGKCRFPHGHNYLFEVSVAGTINPDGMVQDFSELKGAIRYLLEDFDHAFVLYKDDPFVEVLRRFWPEHKIPTKVVVLDAHPTAENIAALVAHSIEKFDFKIELVNVTVFETRDCCARYSVLGKEKTPPVHIVENWE